MVTGTFPAARIVVTEYVVNGGAGPYAFTLACTTALGDVPLPAADTSFSLKNGGSRTVAEQNLPGGDTVSDATSAGVSDGMATVHGAASVDLTSTFPAPPNPGGGGGDGGGLAPTGVGGWTLFGAVPAVLALTAGGVLRTAAQQLRRA